MSLFAYIGKGDGEPYPSQVSLVRFPGFACWIGCACLAHGFSCSFIDSARVLYALCRVFAFFCRFFYAHIRSKIFLYPWPTKTPDPVEKEVYTR